MTYKTKSVKQIIDEIDSSKVYLPALQRRFVWSRPQIELLFDSLMRGYPIGTFLFWRLNRKAANNYVFYEFLKEYDQRDPFNRRKTGQFLKDEITGVLDGQQRLSSIYIGLMGTHTEKTPWGRGDSAYKKASLYVNLLSLPYTIDAQGKLASVEEQNFEFRFLPDEDVGTRISRRRSRTNENGMTIEVEDPVYWLKVGSALGWDADFDPDAEIQSFTAHSKSDGQRTAIAENNRKIRKFLNAFDDKINNHELINYFEIAKEDLEDILKIFVRVNSGGTRLDKTDLLFSTVVATWSEGREQIESLLKQINSKGDKFNFGNEYLMRCCLVLTDNPVVYKVHSFRAENVQKIQVAWQQIAAAIRGTIDLLVEFGFSSELLTSQNATIIIAYYLYHGGSVDKASKEGIRKYLVHALLQQIYSGAQDQLINMLRNALRGEANSKSGGTLYEDRWTAFSFDALTVLALPGGKSLAITETKLDDLLEADKGATSFFILSLLYPNLRYQEVAFHQDHLHPAARFTPEALSEVGVPPEERDEWVKLRDRVPNLQLLEGRQNESKNATPLRQWVEKMDMVERQVFLQNNFVPNEVGLEFTNFLTFYEKRKDLLREKLRNVLAMTRASSSDASDGSGTVEERGTGEIESEEAESA